MKNTSVSGYPGPQRWFGGECSDAFADLPGFGSGTRLRSLGCRYRETICPMPSVQAISLSGSTTRSWSVYNALRCCGEGARTALRIAREGSLVEREREREREKETERMEDRVTEERSAVSRSLLWFERDDVTHRSTLNGEYRAFNENRGNFGGT